MSRLGTEAWRQWRHIVKLDPDRAIGDEVLQALAHSGTDAVFLGGTDGVTHENASRLLGRLRRFAPELPLWQEISDEAAVVDGVDGYAVPVVLNTRNPEWLIGAHARAVARYRPFIDWSRVLVEGYVVLNGAAAVARRTEAQTTLTPEDVAALAVAGEAIFSLPVIYLEYSGTYGDPHLVAEVCRVLRHAHVFYGGGLDSYERAAEIARHADTLIVGNALYGPDWQRVLTDTVRAVREK